jgi:hypothetical protein
MAVIFIFLLIFLVVGCVIYGHTYQQNHPQPQQNSRSNESIKPTVPHTPVTVNPDRNQDAPVRELKYFCIKDKGYHVTVWPKDHDQFDIVEFNIAGMSHRDNIDHYLGEFVGILEAEPANPYDPNAIKVLASDGHHVGYVPAGMTAEIREATTIPCPCFCYIGKRNDIYFSDCYIPRK